jgi:hypothetical protein
VSGYGVYQAVYQYLVMFVLVGTITLKVFHLPEKTARNILHALLSLTGSVVYVPLVLAHRLLLFTTSSHFQRFEVTRDSKRCC